MNILITSVGRRTKLIEYFKNHFNNVIVTDLSLLAPALYVGDKYYIVPRIDSPEYIEELKNICIKENINGILSLIDPELEMLSKNKKFFKEIDVEIIGSSSNVCDICFDKMKMYNFLIKNGFKTQKSYNSLEDFKEDLDNKKIKFPVFVKPITGSASVNISKVKDLKTLEIIFNSNNNFMIQEFMDGKEFGIDVYTDLISKEISSIFIKEKINMRAGETDKAISIKNDKLFDIIKEFVKILGTEGPIDIDVFEVSGEYYISEVNPRFGGGYLLAYECGEKFPQYIQNNLSGTINKINIGSYDTDIVMLKHDNINIIKI